MSIATQPYPTTKKIFNLNLEALRGLAAMLVVWGHATSSSAGLDPNYAPSNAFWTGPGHLPVLFFFTLSGYVIGLSEPNALTQATIPVYLKKRFSRIYPIYSACLFLALAVAAAVGITYSASVIASHLTMTQGISSPIIRALEPSWSLVYEIGFYLAFIPLSYFKLNPWPVILLCLVAGCASAYRASLGYSSPLLPSYFFGATFWMAGLVLAKSFARRQDTPVNYAWLAGFLLLLVSLDKFDAPFTLFHKAGVLLFGRDISQIGNYEVGVVAFRDLAWLAYTVGFVALFSKKHFAYKRLLLSVLILLPAVSLYHYSQHFNSDTLSAIALASTSYLLALVFFFLPTQTESVAERIMKKLIPTGSISYALYLVHYPVLYMLQRVSHFSGSPGTYIVRLLCFLVISFALAYWLEKIFQPFTKKKLFS